MMVLCLPTVVHIVDLHIRNRFPDMFPSITWSVFVISTPIMWFSYPRVFIMRMATAFSVASLTGSATTSWCGDCENPYSTFLLRAIFGHLFHRYISSAIYSNFHDCVLMLCFHWWGFENSYLRFSATFYWSLTLSELLIFNSWFETQELGKTLISNSGMPLKACIDYHVSQNIFSND
jgi:hypothetical protein